MSSLHIVHGNGTCQKHGDYAYTAYRVGNNIVGQVCPECLKEGQIRAEQTLQEGEVRSRETERTARLKGAGVPPLFMKARFDNYKPGDAAAEKNVRVISSYAKAFDVVLDMPLTKGMIFAGLQGTGKTHLACALIDQLLVDGYSAMYASTPTLLFQLRDASIGKYETSLSSLIAKHTSPHLLVLDEYGVNTKQDKDYQLLYSLVDGRYQRNLPTVLVTNVPHEDLERELDERFRERIRGANGPVLGFKWQSFRVHGK